MLSGGLRYAPTTGYSLAALRAARFSKVNYANALSRREAI